MNSVSLALFDYSDRDAEQTWNKMLNVAGLFFTYAFTLECAIKIWSFGFIVHDTAYLRDGWNWLDFFVVMIGILQNIPGIPSLKGLRTLRVLRPLRSINSVPSMKRHTQSLIASISPLANVVAFLLFVFVLFGILGVQNFGGELYKQCRLTEKPENGVWPVDFEITRLCGGDYECPNGRTCGHPQTYDIARSDDYVYNNTLIDYGIIHFDNIGNAMLSIFQVITLEGWTKLMYNLMDSSSSYMSIILFISLVIFGSFFLLNLILAVLMDNFEETRIEEEEEYMEKQQQMEDEAHALRQQILKQKEKIQK